jgi:hypothetical protein
MEEDGKLDTFLNLEVDGNGGEWVASYLTFM